VSELAPFSLKNRNPDVLTCIANLSNDEVFTPPDLASRMLDTFELAWATDHNGESIWSNSGVKFLDPCTKSGVFLREIVERLTNGLADEIPDLQTRVNHILLTQVFGIGITQLTSLLARRSVYCSKSANGLHSIAQFVFENEDGNIWFAPMQHTWVGGREITVVSGATRKRVPKKVGGKCAYCGANQNTLDRGDGLESHAYAFIHTDDIKTRIADLFGDDMQFDVVIGNPPYQLGQSGGDAVGGFAMPVYQKFVQAAKTLDPKYLVMITPSRWFAGGRGLDEYRKEMLGDHRLRVLVDYPDASEAFPGTQIKGGVSYFLWDRDWRGACAVTTIEAGKPTTEPMLRKLDDYDVLVRHNEAIAILEKVLAVNKREGLGTLAAHVSAIQPFSIRTNFRGADSPKGLRDPVELIGNGGSTFIERTDIPRNADWVDQWKVLLGRAYGAGDTFPHQIFNHPIIAGPGSACTETYLVIDHFGSKSKANHLASVLRTRLVRFLVSLRKNTQDIYSDRFQFVPDLPLDRSWTDEMLYEKYSITNDEISFIESMIRPMDVVNE
jgi:hypothetical protein